MKADKVSQLEEFKRPEDSVLFAQPPYALPRIKEYGNVDDYLAEIKQEVLQSLTSGSRSTYEQRIFQGEEASEIDCQGSS